uniref:Uncharacterized protein n=1 Tax=viral metagenome TaxID=1070528 RepID=A0A6C0H2U0_9ZZZZ
MSQPSSFNTILPEILKRKRKPLPEVLLTGKSIDESMNSKYSLYLARKTATESNQFKFNEKDVKVSMFNPRDYDTELLYMKLFTKTIYKDYKPTWNRCTAIIKISDSESKVFYMYIRIIFSDQFKPHNKELDYRIVYSSSFDDLVTFIYKPKEIPDFLNSDAFVSNDDKTLDIIKTPEESSIKKVEYDKKHVTLMSNGSIFGGRDFIGRLIITIDSQTRSITATTSNHPPEDTYKTYYKRYDCYVNEIMNKGNDKISIKIAISSNYVTINIVNEFETLKTFLLKKIDSARQSDFTEADSMYNEYID